MITTLLVVCAILSTFQIIATLILLVKLLRVRKSLKPSPVEPVLKTKIGDVAPKEEAKAEDTQFGLVDITDAEEERKRRDGTKEIEEAMRESLEKDRFMRATAEGKGNPYL